MDVFRNTLLFYFFTISLASYHEQYRVPVSSTDRWESYVFLDKEYVVQNLAVTWENANILCRGQHNGTVAHLDTKDKAEFLAEALSETQFSLDSVWVGARRGSADDPAGYRWGGGLELRRTAADVLTDDHDISDHYPLWQNRTHVPVPEGGADCVALQRVSHDKPVFLDLPCLLERPFVCERDAQSTVTSVLLKSVRCRSGLYHIHDGQLDWSQAAAYCILKKMTLANIGTMKCLKKLGLNMLKTRPSIESAWIGARGSLGKWLWSDTGASVFTPSVFSDTALGWPPMRDRRNVKQSGCLLVDRHASHPPVFLEARCERKLQFICYQGLPSSVSSLALPSDDLYYYVLVRQQLYWQHAYDNCRRINGTLAGLDNADVLMQLLLAMGENVNEPVGHIWVSGRLNMSKDVNSDTVSYSWYNPRNRKIIPTSADTAVGLYMPPWLDEDFNLDNSCLNLDRQDHLNALVYGLPCDTPQFSICMIDKSSKPSPADLLSTTPSGYETS